MVDQLISFETAKLAKKKGFISRSKYYQIDDNDEPDLVDMLGFPMHSNDEEGDYYEAPTQSLLQKWLREEHNIHIVVIPFARDSSTIKSKSDYYVYVNKKQFYGFINLTDNDKPYNSYEEALEQGLYQSLLLIK